MTACGGTRVMHLGESRFKPLDSDVPVTVYVGQPDYAYDELAIVDSTAVAYVDEDVKREQLEELKREARKVGGNLVLDVRILQKRMRGFTIDEQVPFKSWKQGEYRLYFMRGVAARAPYEESVRLDEMEPANGWLVDQLPVPRELSRAEVAP